MTTPILTLAEVQALAGFTEGPWFVRQSDSMDGPRYSVRAYDSGSAYPITGSIVSDHERADASMIAAAPALHATCLHLHAEVARLTALQPLVDRWRPFIMHTQEARELEGLVVAIVGADGWSLLNLQRHASGPETGDAGKRAADLALVAAGYRLVGGVFGEVSDGT